MEIERKFKVAYLPKNYQNNEYYIMEQGYLCSNPTVRIRKRLLHINDKKCKEEYILTYKSKFGEVAKMDKSICASNEYEMILKKESYEHLREKIDNNIVAKTRYHIMLETGQKAELDIFKGLLEGIMLVEVEFETQEEALSFKAPDWFGEDVSSDFRYKNLYMSTINDKENAKDLI